MAGREATLGVYMLNLVRQYTIRIGQTVHNSNITSATYLLPCLSACVFDEPSARADR